MDSVGEAIVACGEDGGVTHASRGARDLLGPACDPASTPTVRMRELVPRTPEGLPLELGDLPLVRALRDGAARESEILLTTLRGEIVLLAQASPLLSEDDSPPLGAVVVLRDVS